MKATALSPLLIPQPFATGNNATLTPIEKSSGTMPNFEDGIPANFSAPKSGGGSYFQRGMMNAIGNMASANGFFRQCGGFYTYDSEVATAIGGYPKGCVLHWYSEGKYKAIRSLVDDNTWDFTQNGVDGIHWADVSTGGVTMPTFEISQRQILWNNSAAQIGEEFGAISTQFEMPFDGYVNYMSAVNAGVGTYKIPMITQYSSTSATSLAWPIVPSTVLAGSLFGVVLAISSPDDETGIAPDIVLDTSDFVSGERNCAVFVVDGMGIATAGAGCGVIPVKKGSKLKLFGQETYTHEFQVPVTRTVVTTAGSTSDTVYYGCSGTFSAWLRVEAYPMI